MSKYQMDYNIQQRLLQVCENELKPKVPAKASVKYQNVGKVTLIDAFCPWTQKRETVAVRHNNGNPKPLPKEQPMPSWKDRDRQSAYAPQHKVYEFKHYHDMSKYMDQYRLYNTCQVPIRAMSARQLQALHEAREKTIREYKSVNSSGRYIYSDRDNECVSVQDLLSSQPKTYIKSDVSVIHKVSQAQCPSNGLKIESSTIGSNDSERSGSGSKATSRTGSARETIEARAGGNINLTPKTLDAKLHTGRKSGKTGQFPGKAVLKIPQQGYYDRTIISSPLRTTTQGNVQTLDLLSSLATNKEKQSTGDTTKVWYGNGANENESSTSSTSNLSTKCLFSDNLNLDKINALQIDKNLIPSEPKTPTDNPSPDLWAMDISDNEEDIASAKKTQSSKSHKIDGATEAEGGTKSRRHQFIKENLQDTKRKGSSGSLGACEEVLGTSVLPTAYRKAVSIERHLQDNSKSLTYVRKSQQMWWPPSTAPAGEISSQQGFSKPFNTERQTVTSSGKNEKPVFERDYTVLPTGYDLLSLQPSKQEKHAAKSKSLTMTLDCPLGLPVPIFKQLSVNTNQSKSKLYKKGESRDNMTTKKPNNMAKLTNPKMAEIIFLSSEAPTSKQQKQSVRVIKGLKNGSPAIVNGDVMGEFHNLTWIDKLEFLRHLPKPRHTPNVHQSKSMNDLSMLATSSGDLGLHNGLGNRKMSSSKSTTSQMTATPPKLKLVHLSQPRVNNLNEQFDFSNAGGFGNYSNLRTSQQDKERYDQLVDHIKQQEDEFSKNNVLYENRKTNNKMKSTRSRPRSSSQSHQNNMYTLIPPIRNEKVMSAMDLDSK